MTFPDLALARRLERAEGFACAQYASAQKQISPETGAEWMECGGAFVVFNGKDSPITQTFGLGLFDKLTDASLETIERFFFDRGAPADHEVSPFAGADALNFLCKRGYRPVEISNVLYRRVEAIPALQDGNISVRIAGADDAQLWTDISARGWSSDHPELLDFIRRMGAISAARGQTICFLAEIDGQPGAAGALCVYERVALFCGAATVPELRRRGLQAALLQARFAYAAEHGYDLAMMVAEAGSNSQRNAERQGFRVAYTRMKWRLALPK